MPPRKAASDFDTKDLLTTQGEQEKTISDLSKRVTTLEGHLSPPQNLAKFFENSAHDSRVLDSVFATMFCRFLRENGNVQQAFKARVDHLDRNFFLKAFKRVGFVLYSLLLVVGTAILSELARWIVSWLSHK